MTYPYSAGKTARIEGFTTFIADYYVKKGYSNMPSKAITNCSIYLNRFFEHEVARIIPDCYKYLEIVRKSVKNATITHNTVKALHYPYPYYDCYFCKAQRETTKVLRTKITLKDPLLGTSLKHRFSIMTFKEEYDREEMATTLPSIFIHGVEATILYALFSIILEINKELIEAGLPPIYLFSNHDCLGINMTYNFLLEPLLMLAYNIVSNINFLSLLKLNLTKDKILKVSNPYFIRY